jgi:hypothetical protein
MNKEVNLGSGNNMLVTTAKLVSLNETLVVLHEGRSIELNVTVQANFAEVSDIYHEVLFNMMTSRYTSRASFGDNPFSQCVPISKKRWWQFWK